MNPPILAVVGAGPAGLMAAETALEAGWRVVVFDAMPTAGRKLLVAGSSGLNLTKDEPFEAFLGHYGPHRSLLEAALTAFSPAHLRAWAADLGVPTFVGTSGRVFPEERTAAGLLKAWLARLERAGAEFRYRHRWVGWDETGALRFETPEGTVVFPAEPLVFSTVLALGGASWPQTGSTGQWADVLAARGVTLSPFRPANCGFDVAWSTVFRERWADTPLKSVAVVDGKLRKPGELLVTSDGLEGSLLYAFAAPLRDSLERTGQATLFLDLAPDVEATELAARWARRPAGRSESTHLDKALHLGGVKGSLLREAGAGTLPRETPALVALIKRCPVPLMRPRPLSGAISTAGGVPEAELQGFELRRLPGVFCAGEMLDWEAPTGGYLLTACWATGKAAAQQAVGLPAI